MRSFPIDPFKIAHNEAGASRGERKAEMNAKERHGKVSRVKSIIEHSRAEFTSIVGLDC